MTQALAPYILTFATSTLAGGLLSPWTFVAIRQHFARKGAK
jgi:hypothetical protein